MADDLMDFSENNENIPVREEEVIDIPKAPGLLQSPVIVNSILKQSNKDNLIQLYTPVQKPEKGRLKVHFGHDSLLETPTVKGGKKKVRTDVKTINEETENTNISNTEDKENVTQSKQQTGITTGLTAQNNVEVKTELTTQTHESNAENAISSPAKVESQVTESKIDDAGASTNDALDYSAMEVSVCETQEPEAAVAPVDDILLQATLLLESLRKDSSSAQDSSSPSKPGPEVDSNVGEKGTESHVSDKTPVRVEETVKDDRTVKTETAEDVHVGDASKPVEAEKNVTEPSSGDMENKVEAEIEGEPMECEEAMDVDDDDDDEIVFNINKKVEETSHTEEKTEEIKDEAKQTVKQCKNDVETGGGEVSVEVAKTVESIDGSHATGNIDETTKVTENQTENAIRNNQPVGDVATEKCEKEVEEASVLKEEEKAEVNDPHPVKEDTKEDKTGNVEVTDTVKAVSRKVGGDDSSDEEFMSADEDMEVDEVKTPAKSEVKTLTEAVVKTPEKSEVKTPVKSEVAEEVKPENFVEVKEDSLERVPPKVGYNLNFDDLEAMDPFAIKKSLVNSPDVGKEKEVNIENKTVENVKDTESNDSNVEIPNEKPETEKVNLDTQKEQDLDSADPFKPKAQIANTPDKAKGPEAEQSKQEGSPNKTVEMVKEDIAQELNKASDQGNTEDVKVETNKSPVKEVIQEKAPETCNLSPQKETQIPADLVKDNNTETPKKEVNEGVEPLTSSPPIPLSRGTYNLDDLDLDEVDPFKPKIQMSNSPAAPSHQEPVISKDVDPFKPKTQIQNSPVASSTGSKEAAVEPSVSTKPESQIIDSPVSSKVQTPAKDNSEDKAKEVPESVSTEAVEVKPQDPPPSPPPKANQTKCDEEINPFETKSQVMNSPVNKVSNAGEKSGTYDLDNLENIDPFATKAQVMNSPLGKEANNEEKVSTNHSEDLENQDPFKLETQIMNSPAEKKEQKKELDNDSSGPATSEPKAEENTATPGKVDIDLDMIDDPFKPKKQMQNSPVKKEIDFDAMDDPFKPKNQMQNSPQGKLAATESQKTENKDNAEGINEEYLEDIVDPFKPRSQMQNSPQVKVQETPKKDDVTGITDEFLDDIEDPFKPKIQMQNSPQVKEPANEALNVKDNIMEECLENISDPFKPKIQMQNSPDVKVPENVKQKSKEMDGVTDSIEEMLEDIKDPFANTDPFKSKKQLKMSPQPKADFKIDPFADLNPFETRTKMSNSPDKRTVDESQAVVVDKAGEDQVPVKNADNDSKTETLKGKNKRTNSSQLQTIEENPFVSKSRVANTPEKLEDAFSQAERKGVIQDDVLGDIFEVQGVTTRGGSVSDKFGEIDDAQFVPASEVFNDPAAWEMLEKLGSGKSKEEESALSRLSLYVKFDPLVDEAPNPRRISIRVSQLEKVKEYGLDETLLLLGTPPKKRAQSLSQLKHTPSKTIPTPTAIAPTSTAQPEKKSDVPAETLGGGVDLILAYSPTAKEQETVKEKGDSVPFMAPFSNDNADDALNLFQELKYTDADLKRIRKEYELAMQGMLINKDQECCKKIKVWEQKYEEMGKKCTMIKGDRDNLEKAFLCLENTVYEIAAARDAMKKEVAELTEAKKAALEDVEDLDQAFSKLQKRYEQAKSIVMSQQKNEETLKKFAASLSEKQQKMEEKIQQLEKGKQEMTKEHKQEVDKLKSQMDAMQTKYDAQVKILQTKKEILETNIQKKTEENKQLTEICDNLLAQV